MSLIDVSTHKRRKPYGGYTNVVSHKRIIKNLLPNEENISMRKRVLKTANDHFLLLKQKGKKESEIKDVLSSFYGKSIINDLIGLRGLKK